MRKSSYLTKLIIMIFFLTFQNFAAAESYSDRKRSANKIPEVTQHKKVDKTDIGEIKNNRKLLKKISCSDVPDNMLVPTVRWVCKRQSGCNSKIPCKTSWYSLSSCQKHAKQHGGYCIEL